METLIGTSYWEQCISWACISTPSWHTWFGPLVYDILKLTLLLFNLTRIDTWCSWLCFSICEKLNFQRFFCSEQSYSLRLEFQFFHWVCWLWCSFQFYRSYLLVCLLVHIIWFNTVTLSSCSSPRILILAPNRFCCLHKGLFTFTVLLALFFILTRQIQ